MLAAVLIIGSWRPRRPEFPAGELFVAWRYVVIETQEALQIHIAFKRG
jgi:hypothetical protein